MRGGECIVTQQAASDAVSLCSGCSQPRSWYCPPMAGEQHEKGGVGAAYASQWENAFVVKCPFTLLWKQAEGICRWPVLSQSAHRNRLFQQPTARAAHGQG